MGWLLLRALGCGAVLVSASLTLRAALFTPAPFELLADRFTLLLPPTTFDLILGRLQYWGKPALLIGLAAVWLGLGTSLALALGLLVQRSRHPMARSNWLKEPRGQILLTTAAALVPWLITGFIIAPAAGAGFMGGSAAGGGLRFSVSLLLTSLSYGLVLYIGLVRWLAERPGAQAPVTAGTDPGRREFVLWLGVATFAVVGATVLSRNVNALLANARTAARGGSAEADGLSPEVTPAGRFYVISKNFSDPTVNPERWALEVSGLVEHPLKLSLDDVRAYPSVKEIVTLECISNKIGGDLISNGEWTGVPLAALLNRAGPKPDAAFVVTQAVDGYTESLPLQDATRDGVLLAYELNGQPISRKHGFPTRLLIPGRYGMKSTKWVRQIVLTAQNDQGYWETRGWDEEAVVKTMARIDVPRGGAELPAGPVMIGGIAFAGDRGISRVEVSIDGGRTWETADFLAPALSRYAWVRWSYPWMNNRTGRYQLQVRAVDGAGVMQIAEDSPDTYPSGATGYHKISVRLT